MLTPPKGSMLLFTENSRVKMSITQLLPGTIGLKSVDSPVTLHLCEALFKSNIQMIL